MQTRKDDELSREAGSPSLPPDRAWELKPYGLGQKPEWGTPEWFDWIESRAMIAGIQEAAEERKKQGLRE